MTIDYIKSFRGHLCLLVDMCGVSFSTFLVLIIISFGAFISIGTIGGHHYRQRDTWWLEKIKSGESPWALPPTPRTEWKTELSSTYNGLTDDLDDSPTAEPWIDDDPSTPPQPLMKISSLECGKREYLMSLGWKIIDRDNDDAYTMAGDVPWMLALKHVEAETPEQSSMSRLLGGATLIHPSFAITTASVIYGRLPQNLQLYAGEWDINADSEHSPPQVRDVHNIILHSNFSFWPRRYDIALLLVKDVFVVTDYVKPLCLPTPSDIKSFPKATCYVSGWGINGFNKKIDPSEMTTLKMTQVPTLSKTECEKTIRGSPLGRSFKLHKSSLCAGGAGNGACMGDFGGPIFCERGYSQTFFLLGMVSWTVTRCDGTLPDIYTSAAFFEEWIVRTMENILSE